jgi:hypothetical protein
MSPSAMVRDGQYEAGTDHEGITIEKLRCFNNSTVQMYDLIDLGERPALSIRLKSLNEMEKDVLMGHVEQVLLLEDEPPA